MQKQPSPAPKQSAAPRQEIRTKQELPARQEMFDSKQLVMLAGLSALLLVSYLPTLQSLLGYWQKPEYSHGWLVPLFAAVLLWLRREPLKEASTQASWWGVCLLAAGLGMRLVGAYFAYPIVDLVSFVPSLVGVFLIVGGWDLLRWAGPALGFLVFMYPLPDQVSQAVLYPLQKLATICSTFALQMLGVPCYRVGNRINLGELQMNVVDACSGLRMATIFLALAVAIILVTSRPWWERIVILLSAVPIALAVNVIRITTTGILYKVDHKLAEAVFHDFAGWIMMPMALGLLFLEMQILSRVFIEEDAAPAPVSQVFAGNMPRTV